MGPGGEPRSENDAELFSKALGALSNWYSHPKTVVLKVTTLPAGYPDGFTFAEGTTPNIADYYGRGWCFKEASVANLVKDFDYRPRLGEAEGGPCKLGRHHTRVPSWPPGASDPR